MGYVYGLSGLTGGGDPSIGDVYVMHDTAAILSGTTVGNSYVVSSFTTDQFGHLSAYTLINLTLDTLSDVITSGSTTDGQILMYNGSNWVSGLNIYDYPTFTYVNTLISGISSFYSGYTNTLDGLTDVNIISPSDYHILVYNSYTAKWVNINPWTDYYTSAQTNSMFWTSAYTSAYLSGYSATNHNHNIVNLSDVTATRLTVGDILVFDGAFWTNSANTNISSIYNYIDSAISGISFSGNTLSGLTDVNINTPILKNVLRYDGRIWVNDSLSDYYTIVDLTGGSLDSRYYTKTYTNANFSVTGHNHFLSNLTDVAVVSPVDYDVMFMSASTWANVNLYTLCYTKNQVDNSTGFTYYYTSAYTNQYFSRTGHSHLFSSITNSAATLANYYTTAQTYTSNQVDALLTGITASQEWTLLYTTEYINSSATTIFNVTGGTYKLFKLIIDGECLNGKHATDIALYIDGVNTTSAYTFNYIDNNGATKQSKLDYLRLFYITDLFSFTGEYFITGSFKSSAANTCSIYGNGSGNVSNMYIMTNGHCSGTTIKNIDTISIAPITYPVNMKIKLYSKTL